jgi:phosphate:Na+ symporter
MATEVFLTIVAGLVLFLFAVNNLSEILQKIIGENAKKYIEKFTSNTFKSILVGTLVTILLDSSSAVIIITIVLVNSKILTFRHAMGIVLGANIGTTFSSQIIAMDIGKYSPLFLLIGFGLLLFSKSVKICNAGKVILYFGILFFGLFTMENAVEPLREDAFFLNWIKKTEDPITGTLIGAIVTVIIQSSSATVGIALILAKKGLLTLVGGVAVMLGAELGTCADTLIATINGSRDALKTGLFHLIFNLISIIIGLFLFYPFIEIVTIVSKNASIERTLANAHMLFNILGVILFVWTVPFFEKLLNKLLPNKVSEKLNTRINSVEIL